MAYTDLLCCLAEKICLNYALLRIGAPFLKASQHSYVNLAGYLAFLASQGSNCYDCWILETLSVIYSHF